MKVSRRKFFELAGAAAGVAALPRGVVEGIVPPAPAAIDLPPAHVPMVGDLIFLHPDGVYALTARGYEKLSRNITFEPLHGLQYNALVGFPGAYAGIDRTVRRVDAAPTMQDPYLRKTGGKRRRS